MEKYNSRIKDILNTCVYTSGNTILEICENDKHTIPFSTVATHNVVHSISSHTYDIVIDFTGKHPLYREYMRIAKKTVYILNVQIGNLQFENDIKYSYNDKSILICVRPISIYTDMCADIFHYGHVRLLKRCKHYLPWVILTVGLHDDESIIKNKRTPICNLQERKEVLESCRYVDRIIPGSPYAPYEKELISKYDIIIYTNDIPDTKTQALFGNVIKLNKFRQLERTPHISTTAIIKRILDTKE